MMRYGKPLLLVIALAAGIWIVLEIGVRLYAEWPLATDFYGSIRRQETRDLQVRHGLKVVPNARWLHLGWIADPEQEAYEIERWQNGAWQEVGRATTGSFLVREPGRYRVRAVHHGKAPSKGRLIGEARYQPTGSPSDPPLFRPTIAGPWQPLFRPKNHGAYINDHDIFRDAEGRWRLVGITSRTDGDFAAEKYFAHAVADRFPPEGGMAELSPLADFGDLAWAPEVLTPEETGSRYMMFWSPHRMPRMTSEDGVGWGDHRVVLEAPFHKFFRDPTILRVGPSQWLMYATARGRYFSQIDLYQSFDLTHWQFIRTALGSGPGSERNSPFASMESPSVIPFRGRYYLAFTYNNDSFFWPGILLMFKIWPDRESYNDTLVLHGDNPYDFGVYRGRKRTANAVARLRTHGPEFIHDEENDRWFVTTAGWPWAATLTSGEVALAPMTWTPVQTGGGS